MVQVASRIGYIGDILPAFEINIDHGAEVVSESDIQVSFAALPVVDAATFPQIILDTELILNVHHMCSGVACAEVVSVDPSDPTTTKSFLVDNSGGVGVGGTGSGTGCCDPYIHTQTVAATVWNVPHSLGHRHYTSTVFVNDVEVTAYVEHIDNNNAQVCFKQPQSGIAIFT
jgi:hypothetical protein